MVYCKPMSSIQEALAPIIKLKAYRYLNREFCKAVYQIWRVLIKLGMKTKVIYQDPFRAYRIDPRRIKYAQKREFNPLSSSGRVLNGDWDRPENLVLFEQSDAYQAVRQHFLEHVPWEQTMLYRRAIDKISKGQVLWGCSSRAEYDQRCRGLDQLYLTIKNRGYSSQKELHADRKRSGRWELDEIGTAIGRSGDYVFNNGRHRLSIAQILGLQQIPVNVIARHYLWLEFRREILSYAQKEFQGRVLYPLIHPDLADIDSVNEEDVFDLIDGSLSLSRGKLLDINAHWGYFCHKFEEKGFTCTAIEGSPENLYFLDRLRQAENRQFSVFQGSFFEYAEKLDFDVVLAIDLPQVLLENQEARCLLVRMLKKSEIKELYLGSDASTRPEENVPHFCCNILIPEINRNSSLVKASLAGKTAAGKSIYKLSR